MGNKSRLIRQRGLTLVEMTIVLGLVIMVATAAMPSIMKIVDANAYAQAENLMAAQLRGARATAVFNQLYSGVHHQRIDTTARGNERLKDRFVVAVLTEGEETYDSRSIFADVDPLHVSGAGWDEESGATDTDGHMQFDNYDNTTGTWNTSATLTFTMPGEQLPHASGIAEYKVYMRWGRWESDGSGETDDPEWKMATNTPVTVSHVRDDSGQSVHTILVDQTIASRRWVLLGEFPFNKEGVAKVAVRANGANGTVVVGGVLLATNSGLNAFAMATGQSLKRIPGSMAFGELVTSGFGGTAGTFNGTTNSFSSGVFDGGAYDPVNEQSNDFTSFSVVFSPHGMLTSLPNGQKVLLSNTLVAGSKRLWNKAVANKMDAQGVTWGEPGVSVITMFNYAKFRSARDDGISFLNKTARLISVNVHMGELIAE
ncbi:hypothetical protein LCGC14_0181500 [marine sediment metagenome]|uniref:Uncharacterized protein n=1 Tax=marine sediment metagenome TaxID=412755 RepID=A0A0F9V5V5_9ZZZZ|nr:hypothetical protein [Phycisphaerae bacterium]HDZ44406.1 hypothetical protein [Phycisphaerae bacterium]